MEIELRKLSCWYCGIKKIDMPKQNEEIRLILQKQDKNMLWADEFVCHKHFLFTAKSPKQCAVVYCLSIKCIISLLWNHFLRYTRLHNLLFFEQKLGKYEAKSIFFKLYLNGAQENVIDQVYVNVNTLLLHISCFCLTIDVNSSNKNCWKVFVKIKIEAAAYFMFKRLF